MQTPNYAELTVHTKAQKYLDDLQAMLDKNWQIRVAEPGDSPNFWPPKAKFCKWLKHHDSYLQQRAFVRFGFNTLDLTEANLKGLFNGCPESFYPMLLWLFSEAKERCLQMHLVSLEKQEVSPGQYRLDIRLVCGGVRVALETISAPTGRDALITQPHGDVVFLYPPHADDNLCDLGSLFATGLSWSRIYNHTVLDGWLEKWRPILRERRLAVMMGTHPRLGVNAWKCCVTTAFNDVYMLQLGGDTLHLIASFIEL